MRCTLIALALAVTAAVRVQPQLANLRSAGTARACGARACAVNKKADATTAPLIHPATLKRLKSFVTPRESSVVTEKVPCGDGEDVDECLALCDSDGCSLISPTENLRKIKIGIYLVLWFALSTGYNIANKQRLNLLPLPWTHSAVSLLVGTLFVTPLWATGLRKPPRISPAALATLLPIAGAHAIGHIGAVVSAAHGAVSFTQIVKASEPVFACVLTAVCFGQTISLGSALALLPIVGGVALASVTELSFTWLAFGGAMVSNLAFAMRNVFSRASMDKPKGENMTPANLFGVLTCLSFCFAAPLALLFEGRTALAAWNAATATHGAASIVKYSVSTGLYFYLYNEVAMMALSDLNPVTHAVANTLKRVVILLACVAVFQTPMTPLCMAGSGIAIAGSYLYAMAKGADKRRAAAAAAAAAA